MKQYLLAHDLGTSGNKATLYDTEGRLVDSLVRGYPTYHPRNGWVEQEADDWWEAVCASTKLLLEKSGVPAGKIACVSFSGQMMGCLLVGHDDAPLRRMLIWADTRSAAQEKFMVGQVGLEKGYRVTGHRLSASYSAAKLLWVRDNEPELYQKAYKMLHAKEYIILKLTGEIVTEYSDASGTNLLDIEKKRWSQELLQAFGIPQSLLPEIYPSAHVAGKVTSTAARLCGLLEGTPVVIGGGDGSCASVGAGVVSAGKVYNVVGSSSWICTAAQQPYFDPEMRTFNWLHLDESLYTPCGTMQAAGYSYAWFRNKLAPEGYKLLDEMVEGTPRGAGGLLFLPYLLGERSPWWDHNARGAFVGLSATSGKAEMARAVLEGVGFNLKIIMDILESHGAIDKIVMIGGGTKGDTWLKIFANIWQKPLLIPRYLEEATSMGAAICGGVGVGAFKDYSVAERFNEPVRVIEPEKSAAGDYARLYQIFRDAYNGLKPVYKALAGL